MGYCESTDVAALCGHVVKNASDFSASTNPTLASACSYVSTGSAFINTLLRGHGFDPPANSSNEVWGVLVQANALYGAALVERVATMAQSGLGEITRAERFWDDFKYLMQSMGIDIEDIDLAAAGLSATSGQASAYGAGISISDIETRESNTDRLLPRFARGQMFHKNIKMPSKATDTR